MCSQQYLLFYSNTTESILRSLPSLYIFITPFSMRSLALIILHMFMNWRDPLICNKSWYIYVTGLYHGWSMAEQEEFPPRRFSSRTGALIHWLGMVYAEKRTFAFRSRSGSTQTPAAVCGLRKKPFSREKSMWGT